MFDRYTERARRVIFFARYEASQYGSQYIDSEHLLLGLVREDRALVARFLETGAVESIRAEVETRIGRNPLIPTPVEIPLSQAGKEILNVAGKESDRLRHKYVGSEHLLMGMLCVEGSMACEILQKRGLNLEVLREAVAKALSVLKPKLTLHSDNAATDLLDAFLASCKEGSPDTTLTFFAQHAEVIACNGRRWVGSVEIDANSFLAPYAKRNSRAVVEGTNWVTDEILLASVLWSDVIASGQTRPATHRMTIVIGRSQGEWMIFLVQVTPVMPER